MARYPYITERNVTEGFGTILVYTNDVTQGWFGIMTLIAVFVITLMGIFSFKKDLFEAWSVSAFFTFLIGVFFWLSNFIGTPVLAIAIANAMISFGLLWFNQNN